MTSKKYSPLITVIIPVFNDQENLVKAVESVKRQGMEDLEIIVIDDGSDRAIKFPAEKGHVLVRHKKNRGAAAARNTGMMQASGCYVAFLDSDDEWEIGKLEQQMRYLTSSADLTAGVFTPYCYEGNIERLLNAELDPRDWFDYF